MLILENDPKKKKRFFSCFFCLSGFLSPLPLFCLARSFSHLATSATRLPLSLDRSSLSIVLLSRSFFSVFFSVTVISLFFSLFSFSSSSSSSLSLPSHRSLPSLSFSHRSLSHTPLHLDISATFLSNSSTGTTTAGLSSADAGSSTESAPLS